MHEEASWQRTIFEQANDGRLYYDACINSSGSR